VSDLLPRIDGVVRGAQDPDDALRAVVVLLAGEPDMSWSGIAFLERGQRVPGPASGIEDSAHRTCVPVLYEGEPVAELCADGDVDGVVLEGIAVLVAPYCLVGWDTGGVPWDTT
jgi:hypothetical protein